jgi:PDZ domain-containing protein
MSEPVAQLEAPPATRPIPAARRHPLGVLLAGLVGLVLLAAFAPVPYVALAPGPTEDTLGAINGTPLIGISGRRTYPAQGRLELVTVSVTGGPGSRLDLLTALRGWVDGHVAVVPEETVYPPDVTAEQVRDQNVAEMALSQQDATVAALRHLGIAVQGPYVAVTAVVRGQPADGRLRPGDRILAVDGHRVTNPGQVREAIEAHAPGERVAVTVRRAGVDRRLVLTTASEGGRTVVGFYPGVVYDYPFRVRIDPGEIGGPSAGLMFALGIVDKLTPGSLTGGAVVAGTGTIDPQGRVGPIGGIQQKIAGAARSGARYFLAPRGNCADIPDPTSSRPRVVAVSTLDEALSALQSIRAAAAAGRTPAHLPACPAGG